MAILPDTALREQVEAGAVTVDDGPAVDLDAQLGPASLDLRLGYTFGVLDTRQATVIDTRQMDQYDDVLEEREAGPDEGIVVHPGEFMLGSTLETVHVPDDLVARIEGRSSYARLGIIPHAAAGYLDPGFSGQVTLEMQNLGSAPVVMYPEDRVCQLVFETMTGPAETPYGDRDSSKYMHQAGPTRSRLDHEHR